jgi:hypothetical protein
VLRCATPAEVLDALASVPNGLIAVDGFQGSGKTTLAGELGKLIGREVLSADDFLHRDQGSFYAHLDLAKLSDTLDERHPCIFEGICCLQVLRGINRRPASLVYVKRMAVWGWADEDELTRCNCEGLLMEVATVTTGLPSNLWDEVAAYHARFRPHECADIVYERSAA